MLAMCWVIMFSALENAAPSAKRIVITRSPWERFSRATPTRPGWPVGTGVQPGGWTWYSSFHQRAVRTSSGSVRSAGS